MSFTYVNSGSKPATASATSVTITLGWTPVVGNLLIVGCGVNNGMGSPSVTDSLSNSYTNVLGTPAHDSANFVFGNIYYSTLTSTGASMTVTFSVSSADPISIAVAEYAPSGTVSTDGNSSNSATTGTALTAGSITTTGSSDLVIGWGVSTSGTLSWSAGGSATLRQSANFQSGKNAGFGLQDQVGVAAGSINPALTAGASGHWVMIGAAFAAAGGVTFQPWIFGDQIQDMQG